MDWEELSFLLLVEAAFFLAVFVQMVLHETGHLLAGLLSGYRFVSFRIGSLILVKGKNGFYLTRFSLPGTGGQCLLRPPAYVKKEVGFPVFWYNLGGVIANVVVSGIGIALLCSSTTKFFFVFGICLAGCGFLLILTNGIPLKLGGISNDGYNALSLKKDPEALYGFWLQLEVNARQTMGERLRDMQEEWFYLPERERLSNPLTAATGMLYFQYLRDCGRYEESADVAEQLLEKEAGLLPIYQNELLCEQLFDELIGTCRPERIRPMCSKPLQAYRKQTKRYLSRLRLSYAYDLLYEKDEKKAAQDLEQFQKRAAKSPVPGEVPGEWEAIRRVKGTTV